MSKRSGASTPAVAACVAAGVPHTVTAYELPAEVAEGYGVAAARALGRHVTEVFKTLIASVDGKLWVAIVPVDHECSLKALAAAAGGKRAEMATAPEAERATGYVVGGISPLGQRKRLPTVLDASAMELEQVFVSAGRRGLELGLAPTDLVALTGAVVATITAADR